MVAYKIMVDMSKYMDYYTSVFICSVRWEGLKIGHLGNN